MTDSSQTTTLTSISRSLAANGWAVLFSVVQRSGFPGPSQPAPSRFCETALKRGPGVQKDPPVVLIAASDRQRSTGYKVAPAGNSRLEGFTGLKHCSGPVDDFLV